MQSPPFADSDGSNIPALHQALVDQLKAKGDILTPAVEAAFRAVPRHLFLPDVPPDEVYLDKVIGTKAINGRFVSSSSQPAIMAIMLEQLQLQPGHRVLEIGAGTGYNAALMAFMVGEAGQVITVDIDEDIVEGARQHLAKAGFERVQVVWGDGGLGYTDAASYDRIILTVNASDITPAWHEQLKPGGRLLLPLAIRGPQLSVAFEQVEDHLQSTSIKACGFMELRGAFATPADYVHLGPEPGVLYIKLGEPHEVDAEATYQLLTAGPNLDMPLHIQVMGQEALWGLGIWLALHEPLLCYFIAYGPGLEQGIVPPLFSFAGKMASSSTIGLLNENTFCLLVRASEEAVAATNLPAFTLSVLSFGANDALARQLAEQVLAWDTAGRPDEQRFHVRAYPQGVEYDIREGEVVVSKQWTRFVFTW